MREEFAEQISAFLQLPAETVQEKLETELSSPSALIKEAWGRLAPSTPAEIARFYQTTDSYIFALAADHCLHARRRIWEVITGRIEQLGSRLSVLCYGDGIGTDSLALAQRGHRVTYFDLPGLTSGFAGFRFQRGGLTKEIRVLCSADAIRREEFDAVVCIEVLEHLPEPVQTMASLVSFARIGGRILLTESFGSVGPEHPSHLPSNAVYAGLTCRIMEQFGVANTFYNTDPVNYPIEFTKLRPGAAAWLLTGAYRLRRAFETRLRRLRQVSSARL